MFARELEVAVEALTQAARLCQAVHRQSAVAIAKNDKSPVTVADFGSQALVCRALAEGFPGDPIVAEEGSQQLRLPEQASVLADVVRHVAAFVPGAAAGDVCGWIDRGGTRDPSPRFWTLDPIDGTKGFLRGEQYAVALGLVIVGQVTLSVLACPNLRSAGGGAIRGALFTAVKGRGAHEQPLCGGSTRPIHVSDNGAPQVARLCESVEGGHSDQHASAELAQKLGLTLPPLRIDSQAKYAVVARGEADIYLRLPTVAGRREWIWDHAGGALLVAQAGGSVTDLDGRPLDFSLGPKLSANRGVVVSNGKLHAALLAALRETG
ncbi:MAG: 3'(2'),5'-bisphosphate nucleotidase [Planctomycetia bacterium]|nr:3'(2'),5'-bisphosphate nucleotidase [Planctomycetia bacterium]